MSDAWKKLDLGGDGLQATNLRLSRALRRRPTAYALLLLFPVGAHRWYLREPVGALAYCALTALALAAGIASHAMWPAALVPLAFAVHDLWWIDQRVTALNKRLRMQAWLRPGGGAPPGFRARFGDDPDP